MGTKTTIADLERILDGPARTIKINPDGSLTTLISDTEKLKAIYGLVGRPLADGEEPNYRKIFYCIQDILEDEIHRDNISV